MLNILEPKFTHPTFAVGPGGAWWRVELCWGCSQSFPDLYEWEACPESTVLWTSLSDTVYHQKGNFSSMETYALMFSKMCVYVLVTQSCPILWDPMDCSPPGSSVHGILQARILESVAISFSRGSSRPRDWTWVSCIAGRFFTIWASREALSNWGPAN